MDIGGRTREYPDEHVGRGGEYLRVLTRVVGGPYTRLTLDQVIHSH